MGRLPDVPVQSAFIAFQGGADFVTPQLLVKPGFAREAQNWEVDVNGGYRPSMGYERYDGRAKPSDAVYAMLTVTLTGTPVVGETITGGTSGATAKLIATETGLLALTALSGTFGSESITGSTSGALGTCTGPAIIDGASTAKLHAQYKNLAADVYRALIGAVPGSGNVLGVWVYNDNVYAFRNDAGGTSVGMYKATTSGWSVVSLGEEISFTNANASVGEGDTLTQGGVTATIKRVVVQTGTLASGVNTGRLIISGRAGGNYAAAAATSTGGGAATLSGAQTAITFAVPSGRFEFVNYNFGGAANTTRMYGCDGKNRAFEFDGTVFVPIATGMTTDAPEHIVGHRNHLFLSFGGSVQFSSDGNPYVWSVIVGAGEIAMGDSVTAFRVQPAGTTSAALAIFTRNNISILYGSTSTDFSLLPFDQEAGGYAYTVQHIGYTIMLDDRGITSLSTTQAFGNFQSATLSKLIHSWIATRRGTSTASCIVRDKNQYRLFFSDGSAVFMTMDNGKILGMLPQLLTDPVRCICSAELSDGSEAIYFGSSDGVVYQMERGTSFDGDDIETYITLVFNSIGNPLLVKDYRGAIFEVEGDGYAELEFSYDLGYASTEVSQPSTQTLTHELRAALWDEFTWDSFYWDGVNLSPSMADFIGQAENFAFRFRTSSDYFDSLRISGALFQYIPRRRVRIGA